ncbi:hypothetical protein D6D29_08129 [Aureobasidium pullulans]|nr:hypothetical protein D6D29_08129 [Aureobasidium pullulans]
MSMEIIPISSLSPFTALPNGGFKALVTLLWPFSSATGQCALLLADPDARQRHQKGQVRVRFTGPSARQIATSGVGIGDSVQVALVGAQWLTESDTALVKTPGKSVDGELIFQNRLHMTVIRNGNELQTIDIDESTQAASPKPSMLPPSTPIAKSKPRSSFDAYGVAVYSSPAFMKRLRLSEGGTSYSPVPVSEDDDLDIVASRKRRRVSYKNVSEWKFDAREPSPEKEQDTSLEDVDADEEPVAEASIAAENSNGTDAQKSQDEEMQDAEPTEVAGQQIAQPEDDAQNAEQHGQESAGSASLVENAEKEMVVSEANSNAEIQPLNVKEPEEAEVEMRGQQSAEFTKQQGTAVEGEPQIAEADTTLEAQASTRRMPPPTLPHLNVLPTESELLEQMARNVDRPTTPILQPLLTEGLPLPSPFPTSAQKIPSPVFSNATTMNEAAEAAATETHTSSSEQQNIEVPTLVKSVTSSQDVAKTGTSPENATEVTQEPSVVPELQTQSTTRKDAPLPEPAPPSNNVEVDTESSATPAKPRTIADTYDGYAGETQVVLSSDSEDEDDDDDAAYFDNAPAVGSSPALAEAQINRRSRENRFDDENSAEDGSDADMDSSSDDSDSDVASSVYNSEQIVALQEESDHEELVEEPDWDLLQNKLDQEEAAIRQSREDLTARGGELTETAEDMHRDEGDDAVMHDDNSEMDDDMLARSDDDSDDDSEGSGYFDRAVMPETEENSSDESEVEMVDQSYHPSIPERDMYSHPFGLDGAQASTQMRTALPSQATSAEGSVSGDETIAWRDRDAAVEALGQQAQPHQTAQVHQQPQPPRNVPIPLSSRLEVVELLDDSESDEEEEDDANPVVPVQHAKVIPEPDAAQETINFLPSIEFVNHLLNNKERDAHLVQTGPATASIRFEIRKISDQASNQTTKWTKFNALKAICKIGVNVTGAAETGNMFAEGVKYRLKEDEVLVSACWKIYNELSNEEKYHMEQPPDMLECLAELEEKRDYCFEGFADFLKQFRQTYHHLAVETRKEQPVQQAALALLEVEPQVTQEVTHEVALPPTMEHKDQQLSAVDEVVVPTAAVIEDNTVTPASPSKMATEELAEAEQPQVEHDDQPSMDAEVALAEAAQLETYVLPPGPCPQSQSVYENSESQSETAEDEPEAMNVEEDRVEYVSEDAGEREIDPALLEDQSESDSASYQGHEIDPALLQDEEYHHEIDPAILADGNDSPSDGHLTPMQFDDAMSDAPEPDAFSLADDDEAGVQSQRERDATMLDESMTDELPVSQNDEQSLTQMDEVPMKLEVQPSVETDPELLGTMKTEGAQLEAPPVSTPSPEEIQQIKDEIRPVSSSSFKTLSPSPGIQASQSVAPSATPGNASQLLDQPIEELDLSQVEPSWTSRFSQFSQSRSSRAHTRSETIPDSADEDATDLVAEGSEGSSRAASPEPMTQASPKSTQKAANENLVQPSQELGTAFSQFSKQAHGPSGLQSQLVTIDETPPPEEDEAADEIRSQAGLDDELLADYVQGPLKPAEISTPSKLPSIPSSTPRSTKKPARPLTLFRGRKSVGSRLSIGGSEQQAGQDEVMQDALSGNTTVPAATEVSGEGTIEGKKRITEEVAEVMTGIDTEGTTDLDMEGTTGGTAESEKQVQTDKDPGSLSDSPVTVKGQSQPAQPAQNAPVDTEAKKIVPTSTAPEPEVSVEQPQVSSEIVQATSNFQLKPTLKPFAEVEASLFGTPIKNKAAAPQEPQSAPSQPWRNTLTSKMSDVPLIGSWFTPRRTTVAQKAVTEHRATTSSTSLLEETPTKAAPAPLTKQIPRQRSISPPPLQRYASQGTSTSLSYFTPLAALHQHLNQQSSLIDIVAVCTTSTTTAERAKSGPKDYYTTFRIVDQPLHEYSTASQTTPENDQIKDVRVEIFRPFKQSLPKAAPGDVVLLRGFVVRSRGHKNYLLSTAASGWCVWRYDRSPTALDYDGQAEEDDRPFWARKGDTQKITEDGVKEEVTGPPVEIGDEEREKVVMVRSWWENVQKEKPSEEKKDEPDVIMID